VQEQACRALAGITVGTDAAGDARKQKAADAGALPEIVAAMKTHQNVAGVQEHACWALANITAGTGAARGARAEKAVDAGALEAIVEAMNNTHQGVAGAPSHVGAQSLNL
jgi:hypothetical protein